MSKAPPASRTVADSQHSTWRVGQEKESVHTDRERHDHVTCHARAILPAANTDVLGVKSDGAVKDDCGDADGRVWLHGDVYLCCCGDGNGIVLGRYAIKKMAVSRW